MKRFLATLALVVLCASSVAVGTDARATTLQRILDQGELRVGTSGNQPPFTMRSKDGTLIGYEIDLAGMLANAMGVELKLVEKPFGELLDALEANEVDVVMSGMTMTPRRNLRAAFVGPYVISGKSILTKDQTIARIDEASDLDASGLNIAVLSRSTSQEFVERNLPEANLVAVANYDEGVAMVLDDRVDLMIADYPICALSVLRHADQGLVTLAEPLTIEPIGIAIRPDAPLLLNMIENYLTAIDAMGVLDELETLWFDDPSWLSMLP